VSFIRKNVEKLGELLELERQSAAKFEWASSYFINLGIQKGSETKE
jgi:hypothetical protein